MKEKKINFDTFLRENYDIGSLCYGLVNEGVPAQEIKDRALDTGTAYFTFPGSKTYKVLSNLKEIVTSLIVGAVTYYVLDLVDGSEVIKWGLSLASALDVYTHGFNPPSISDDGKFVVDEDHHTKKQEEYFLFSKLMNQYPKEMDTILNKQINDYVHMEQI